MMKDIKLAQNNKTKLLHPAKECAYLAMFVALVIAVQVALSIVPGVELVTVMFVVYSFTLGVKRGVISATAFSLLRQIVFGVYPVVLILYLIYYNLLALLFGFLGNKLKNTLKWLWLIVLLACIMTICFTMLDNVLTPWWYGYTKRSFELYFKASLTFMLPQVVCVGVSVGVMFYPLYKVFSKLKSTL